MVVHFHLNAFLKITENNLHINYISYIFVLMDNLKNKLKNWEFRDSIAWKENRCASKSQRTLIDRSYRERKRSARQLDRKYIETEIENNMETKEQSIEELEMKCEYLMKQLSDK